MYLNRMSLLFQQLLIRYFVNKDTVSGSKLRIVVGSTLGATLHRQLEAGVDCQYLLGQPPIRVSNGSIRTAPVYLLSGGANFQSGVRFRDGDGQAGHFGTRLPGPMFMTPAGS
jgi:hypothetical protein